MKSIIDNLTLLLIFMSDIKTDDEEMIFLIRNMKWSIGYLERKINDIPWMGQSGIRVLKGTLIMEVVKTLIVTKNANIQNSDFQAIVSELQRNLNDFLKQDLTNSFTAFQEEDPIIAGFSQDWIVVGEVSESEYFRLYQGIPLSIVYWPENKMWLSRIAGCSLGFFPEPLLASSNAEDVADKILQPPIGSD
jgi:hypothetical protein